MEQHVFKRQKLSVDGRWQGETTPEAAGPVPSPAPAPQWPHPPSCTNFTPSSNTYSTGAHTTTTLEVAPRVSSFKPPEPPSSPSRFQPPNINALHDDCSRTDARQNGCQTASPSERKDGFIQVCYGMVSSLGATSRNLANMSMQVHCVRCKTIGAAMS